MPNTRKKLIELLANDNCPLFMVFGENMDGLADHLIANGVTIATDNNVGDKISPTANKLNGCLKCKDIEGMNFLGIVVKNKPQDGIKPIKQLGGYLPAKYCPFCGRKLKEDE